MYNSSTTGYPAFTLTCLYPGTTKSKFMEIL